MRQSVKRAQKHRVFSGLRTRTENLGFDAKCSVVAQNGKPDEYAISKSYFAYACYMPAGITYVLASHKELCGLSAKACSSTNLRIL